MAHVAQRADSPHEEREFAHQRELMVERHVAARGVSDERCCRRCATCRAISSSRPSWRRSRTGPARCRSARSRRSRSRTSSARMIELLELDGKEKVLEIGTGTGYQAVVLSKLCAKVFSIERINELALAPPS